MNHQVTLTSTFLIYKIYIFFSYSPINLKGDVPGLMAKGKPPLPEEDITTVKKTRFPPLLPHNTSQEAAGNASVPKVRGAQD